MRAWLLIEGLRGGKETKERSEERKQESARDGGWMDGERAREGVTEMDVSGASEEATGFLKGRREGGSRQRTRRAEEMAQASWTR